MIDSESYFLGVDEAGRGPVLGPMVYGIAWCPTRLKESIGKLGLHDSKVMTEAERDKIMEQWALGGHPINCGNEQNDIKHVVGTEGRNENRDGKVVSESTDSLFTCMGHAVRVLSPEFLSANMLKKRKHNLNEISHDSCIFLIKLVLDKGLRVAEVFVDTVGDPEKYAAKLSSIFPDIKICVSKKADSLYPIVSAASIVAKVTRDKLVADWHFPEETLNQRIARNYGSGYPADERTKTWLVDHCDKVFGFPSFVRFSWGTCKKMMLEKCVKVDWGEDDIEEDEDGCTNMPRPKKQQKLNSYFSNAIIKQNDRASFFNTSTMHVVEKDFPF